MHKIDLPRAKQGHTRGGFGSHLPFDAIDIGQALHVEVGIALEEQLHPTFIAFQDEGAGTDGGLRFVEVAILVLRFLGEDHVVGRTGELGQERRKWVFGDDLDGVIVHDFDAVDIVEACPEAGFGGEALQRILHVVSLQLAAVHRRLIVELHPFTQVKHYGLVVQILPALGQVGHDGEVIGAFLFVPVGESHQTAVDQAADILRIEGDAQVRIQIGGLALGQPDDPAVLRLFASGCPLGASDRAAGDHG